VSRSAPLLQMQADLLGHAVVRPKVSETTALGAAALAGIGVGAIDAKDFSANWTLDVRVEPQMNATARAARLAEWTRAVERSLNWRA